MAELARALRATESRLADAREERVRCRGAVEQVDQTLATLVERAEASGFDAIVVTAAASHVPPPLIRQLKPGGRMVIPVGGRFLTQQLLLIEKQENDEITTRQIAAVRFVPLTGER